jgi:Uma2 family endonuclease
LVEAALRLAFGVAYCVRGQMPLVLNQTTDPLPDVAVVTGSVRDFVTRHPDSAVLVVEVSDSTLAYDTGSKASLYAAAGIADYWVVDLVHRQLIVHRGPVADAGQPHGAKYASVTTLDSAGSTAPLAAAGNVIQVADLLP